MAVDISISEYEDFRLDHPNATADELESRFGLPADELYEMYIDYLSDNPAHYQGHPTVVEE